MKPYLSVVVPAFNAAQTIEKCLVALERQTTAHAYEVIIVDNGSQDTTPELVRATGAKLIVEPKPGASAARNAGIRAAEGEIICFTDADCVPTANWLEEVSAPLRRSSEVTGCKGTYLTNQPELIARFVQIEYEDKYDLLRDLPAIDFIDTYSAAYRRQALLDNDGFDESISFTEDQELSFRLAARGYQMRFQPSAQVYHRHSDTLLKYFRKKFFIGYWKAQVVRRFPTRGVKDSHTPQVLKVQMALSLLTLGALGLLPLLPLLSSWLPQISWGWLSVFPLLGLLTFLLTTLPFVTKGWRKDQAVALASPFLLLVRALALSFGYLWGILRPDKSTQETDVNTISGSAYIAKRLIDILGGSLGLLTTAVCFPFIALAIRLDSPGPIIFKQTRVGQGGSQFTIYKFRSMHAAAEAELPALVNLAQMDSPAFKIIDDPRITRVGRWLRRWSLDEMPQFWNVLKGDMSLIGPRPEEERVVALYNSWHRRRLSIKPGMSGPMQVNGRGDLPLDQRVELELDYIENYSLAKDIQLLLKTIPSIIEGKGAR